MPRWTFPMTDFVTGKVVAENVPLSGVKFSDALFAKGKLSAMFPVSSRWFPDDPRELLGGRRIIWPCLGGQPFGAFVLSEMANTDLRQPAVPVTADSWWEWVMDRRELYHSMAFLHQEQLSIARDYIRYAVGVETVHSSSEKRDDVPYSLPWVQWGQAVSGIYRTLKPKATATEDGGLDGSKGVKLGKLFMDLSDRGGEPGTSAAPGFEARPDYGWDPDTDTPFVRMTLRSPTIGTGRNDPKRKVFEYPNPGGAVLTCSYGASSKDFATRVRVIGREKDGITPTASKRNTTKLAQGWPLVDASFTTDNTTDTTRLSDKAAARYRLATVQAGWSLTLDGAKNPQLGDYRLGDWVIIRARRGERRLPDQPLRITGWSIDVDDSLESETVTPQFAEE